MPMKFLKLISVWLQAELRLLANTIIDNNIARNKEQYDKQCTKHNA